MPSCTSIQGQKLSCGCCNPVFEYLQVLPTAPSPYNCKRKAYISLLVLRRTSIPHSTYDNDTLYSLHFVLYYFVSYWKEMSKRDASFMLFNSANNVWVIFWFVIRVWLISANFLSWPSLTAILGNIHAENPPQNRDILFSLSSSFQLDICVLVSPNSDLFRQNFLLLLDCAYFCRLSLTVYRVQHYRVRLRCQEWSTSSR